jgi:hypothetical protein
VPVANYSLFSTQRRGGAKAQGGRMGISLMKILFYENQKIMVILQFMSIIIIIYFGLKKFKLKIIEYKNGIIKNKIKIIGIMCVYIIFVLMPIYIK